MATAEEYEKMSPAEKRKEDWMNSKWRPAMGWLYMLVCFCDFVLFPILHAIYIAMLYKGAVPPGVPPQWSPLTLQGAGLFHLAMGAVLGLAAWGRTQEKLGGANNGGFQSMVPGGATAFSPAPSVPGSFSAPTTTSGFGSTGSTGGTSAGSFGGTFATTSSGKTIIPTGNDPEK